jgi:predicted amino acid dehydrogenase
MGKFGFIIHPLCISDFSRKFAFAEKLPDGFIKKVMGKLPPIKAAHITGIESPKGKAEGYFIAVPLLPEQMLGLPTELVERKILKACRMAQGLGAQIVGLGAFTSVVGDKGLSIAQKLDIPLTTGNSYTVATALEAVRQACKATGRTLGDLEIVIIGANGSIGSTCAKILAREAKYMTLVSRDIERLEKLAEGIMRETGLAVHTTNMSKGPLKRADIVITVSSSVDTIIRPEHLKRGAIVCDVARPRDVSAQVAQKRKDVVIIEGGIVKIPGRPNLKFDFGLPPGMCYACMAETMILAMESRFENYSIGSRLELEKVNEISQLARKHDFRLAGFRGTEGFVDYEKIGKNAERYKSQVR